MVMSRIAEEEVTKLFEDHNYTRLGDYVNANVPIEYRCNIHPETVQKIRLSKLKLGQGCKACANIKKSEKNRIPFPMVKRAFEDRGYELLTDDYKTSAIKLPYKCSKHPEEIQHISYNTLQQGHGCRFCYTRVGKSATKRKRVTYEQVVAAFKGRGYLVTSLESEFVNSKTPIRYRCINHPEDERTLNWNNFQKGHGCMSCFKDSQLGENSFLWNADLEQDEREIVRVNLREYRQWRKQVVERDNYSCLKCGTTYGRMNAHHKDGWHWCKERRFDLDNGATLCDECHKDFHHKCGVKNNTEEQYKEWV